MPMFDAKKRYDSALQYLGRLNDELKALVQSRTSAQVEGEAISLGVGHFYSLKMTESQRDGLRALLLCHLASAKICNTPVNKANLEEVKKQFSGHTGDIDRAIMSFTALPYRGPDHLARAASDLTTAKSVGVLTFRGDRTYDPAACWHFTASCAFHAGFMSLIKWKSDYLRNQSNPSGTAERVLMNRVRDAVDPANYNTIQPGLVVGFYRVPLIEGPRGMTPDRPRGVLVHVAVSTVAGSCRSLRQPANPTRPHTQTVADVTTGFPRNDRIEAIEVRTCDPRGMEDR